MLLSPPCAAAFRGNGRELSFYLIIIAVMNAVKPYRIVVEWSGNEDFFFRCDYALCELRQDEKKGESDVSGVFPVMTRAMGNVLRKLRNEHISFPLFLVSLALNHRNLLQEIDQLLQLLHGHLDKRQHAGSFTCFVRSKSPAECPGRFEEQIL